MIHKIEHQVSRWPWQIILFVCIFGATGLLVFSEMSHQRVAKQYEIAIDSMRTYTHLGRLLRKLAEAESGQRGFLLTHDEKYLEPYSEALPGIDEMTAILTKSFALMQNRTDNGQIDPRISNIVTMVDKRNGELVISVNLARKGQWETAISLLKTGTGKAEMNTIRSLVDQLRKEQDAKTFKAIQDLRTGLVFSRWTINALAALNIVLLVLVTFWLRSESRRGLEREAALDNTVKERTAQLSQLAAHLQQISEVEKSRLGRELHDELGSILTASKMDIAWVKTQMESEQTVLAEKLSRALKNLDQGIQIKRRIIEGLRPTTLASFGLMTAVRELIEATAEQCNWTLELELPKTDPDLSEDAEITMFRILQESVTNIAKYAKASRVRISLHCMHGEHCKLEIEDNGVGFRQADVRPKAAGLLGMRERLRAQGGTLDIESGPGKGTLIRALLPLAAIEQNVIDTA